ncbi:MAG: pitrilysin family protein [Pseudomonadota bacterium]
MRQFLAFIAPLLIFVSFISSAFALEFKQYHTLQGTEIWHYKSDHLPLVSARIVFPHGSASDPENKVGLATLAAATMDEGAGPYDSSAFRALLKEHNINFSFEASRDFFALSLEFLKLDMDKVIELSQYALSEPRFDAKPVGLMKGQISAMLSQSMTDPDELAARFATETYFDNHPYNLPSDGYIEDVKNITKEDLQKFTKYLAQKNGFVVIVGDLEAEDAKKFANQIMSVLPQEPLQDKSPIPIYNPDIAGQKIFVPLSVGQTYLLFQGRGVLRHDKDFAASFVAAHILGGGGFGSALMEELREKNGLTYGAASYLASGRKSGRFVISYATDQTKVQKSIDIVESVLDDYIENGISAKELSNAIQYLKGYYPIQFNTNEQIAFLGQRLWEDGMPHNYPQLRDAYFEALTPEDVSKAAKNLFNGPFQIIAVGGEKPPAGFKVAEKSTIRF